MYMPTISIIVRFLQGEPFIKQATIDIILIVNRFGDLKDTPFNLARALNPIDLSRQLFKTSCNHYFII